MTSRLLIHTGFAKCGSASIRTAIFQNFRNLQKNNIFVFDKNLRIARTAATSSAHRFDALSRRGSIPKTSREDSMRRKSCSGFFNLFGLSRKEHKFESEARNSSPDVSILHVLSKNPQLFSDVHDNRLMLALTRALPKQFRSTNIEMLSPEEEGRIEGCFRDENRWLLNTYCSDADVDGVYRMHFMPRKADARYSDMTESELIYRCLGIILESIASSGGESDRGKNRNQEHDSVSLEQE